MYFRGVQYINLAAIRETCIRVLFTLKHCGTIQSNVRVRPNGHTDASVPTAELTYLFKYNYVTIDYMFFSLKAPSYMIYVLPP